MKIAVLSDTHSRYGTIDKALKLLEGREIAYLLHCGDIEDAEAVRQFPAHTHFVFGNCDHDRDEIRAAVQEIGATLQEPFGHLELPEATIAFLHGDDRQQMRELELSGHFDYLFHGHTHEAAESRVGPTRIINPGALHRARPKTFLIVDLATGQLESVEVD